MRAVISFHAIDEQDGPLSFPPAALKMLLQSFADAGLPVLELDNLLSGKVERGVALTFDDGIESLHGSALPVLAEFNAPAHLFLTTGFVAGSNQWPGQPDYARRYGMLNWDQVEALHGAGVRIEAHTAHHPDLRTLSDDAVRDELHLCNAEIEKRLGRAPRFFAYPYGLFDRRVRSLAGSLYDGCFTTQLRFLPDRVQRDAIPRLDSHYLRNPSLARNLDSPAARFYIAVRNLIRRVRGRT